MPGIGQIRSKTEILDEKKEALLRLFIGIPIPVRPRSPRVSLPEFIDSSTRIDDLLFACVERMAVRAHFDLQIVTKRRTRRERVTATTGHGDFLVVGMNAGFHGIAGLLSPEGLRKMGAQCSRTHRQSQDDR